jgi:hypothetical protein
MYTLITEIVKKNALPVLSTALYIRMHPHHTRALTPTRTYELPRVTYLATHHRRFIVSRCPPLPVLPALP